MGNPERSQFALRRSQRLLGTRNPEIGCNVLGLRRSPRLHRSFPASLISYLSSFFLSDVFFIELAKSAMNMSQSTEMAPSKPGKAQRLFAKGRFDDWSIQYRGTAEKTAKRRRFWRQAEARIFEGSYSRRIDAAPSDGDHNISGRNSKSLCCNDFMFLLLLNHFFFLILIICIHDMEEKRCIVVSDHVFYAHDERSHGITWVAVHGINSICAVYKRDESEIKRICDLLGRRLRMQYFGRYLLSEMEDLADSSTYSDKLFGKPFAVVSLYSGTNVDEASCHKASAAVPDEHMAIDFLQGKLKTDSAIADYETVQTAIAAFQHLFHQEFKSDEIRVCVFKDNTSCEPRRPLTTSVIDEHLAVIKRRSINKSLQLMDVINDDLDFNAGLK